MPGACRLQGGPPRGGVFQSPANPTPHVPGLLFVQSVVESRIIFVGKYVRTHCQPVAQSPLKSWAAVGPPPRPGAPVTDSAGSSLHCPPQPGAAQQDFRPQPLPPPLLCLCSLSLTLAHPREVTWKAGGSEPAALGGDQTLPGGSVTRFQNSPLSLPVPHLRVPSDLCRATHRKAALLTPRRMPFPAAQA